MSVLYSNSFFHRKVIEPKKRIKGNPWPEWQSHRFPIKDGISWRDAMLIDMSRPNPLLELVRLKRRKRSRR